MVRFKINRLLKGCRLPGRSIRLALAGCLMLTVSILPWLRTPFGQVYSAWQLPIDTGWPIQSAFLNYGVLCLICAFAAFWAASITWRPYRKALTPRNQAAGIIGSMLCLAIISLFLAQYLLNDLAAIDQLAQQKNQMLLISGHFGYTRTPELFSLKAMSIDISDIGIRFQLLVDQLQAGVFLLIPALCLMLNTRATQRAASSRSLPVRAVLIGGFLLFILLITGRAFAGMIAQNLAGDAMAQGDYVGALQWLDRAVFFDPAISQVPSYHIERGQAEYFLYPNRQSDDSRAFVATLLVQQKDYQGAYQLLSISWQSNASSPWLLDQLSSALESLAESAHPAQLQYLPQKPQTIVAKDGAALPWLHVLAQIDSGNVYAHYMIGRIDYDLQEYLASKDELLNSLQLDSDEAYQSSVYTYVAFSDYRVGNYVEGRAMLLRAIQLDPEYRNDVARNAASGL